MNSSENEERSGGEERSDGGANVYPPVSNLLDEVREFYDFLHERYVKKLERIENRYRRYLLEHFDWADENDVAAWVRHH